MACQPPFTGTDCPGAPSGFDTSVGKVRRPSRSTFRWRYAACPVNKLTPTEHRPPRALRRFAVYRSCEEAAQSGSFDYVLCASKALLDAKPYLEDQIRSVVSSSTTIVLLQNGVGAEEPLHVAFPDNTIISAVVWTGGRIVEDGVVQQFNREGLTIGVDWRRDDGVTKREEKKKLDLLVDILRAGGGDCTVADSIQSERWVKVIW